MKNNVYSYFPFCLSSNDEGLTAKELLEHIHNGNFEKKLDFNEDSFQEILDTKIGGTSSESLDYKNSIKSIIERLNDVEINGYSPLEITKTDASDEKIENDSVDIHAKSNTNEQSEVDDSQNSKKKKKKKKKGQTGNDDGADELSVTPSVSSVAKRETDIDLVSMLLAMGFAEEQINAAVDACGGTDRATADDLVEWILSGGASTDSNSGANAIDESSQSARNGTNSSEPYASQMAMSDNKQKRILTQAEREAEEAAKREAEAKAAAERLAAKREEQRRIRLEWNNREQLRQQEEAKAKLAKEVERKRRIEIEKAKIAAQRVAKEHAAAVGATMMYQDSNSAIASMSEGLQMQNNSNVGSTPLFPGMTFQGDHNLSPESQYYAHTQSPHVGFNQSMIPQAEALSYPQVATTFRSSPVPGSDLSSHDYSGSKSKTKKTSPINIDVNGNEFPVLGANKSSSPNRRNKSKKGSPNSGDNKKVGKAKTRKKKEHPIKDNRSMEFVPPHVNNMISEQVVSDQAPYMQRPYESNPLGEIRATAKAFVPTHFKPTTSMPPGFNNTPKPQQPDFVAPSTSNPLILSNMAPGSSLLSTNPSRIPSLNAAAATTTLKESSAPFDTSAISLSGPTTIGIPFEQSKHSNQTSFASPSPMTLSFGSSKEMVHNDVLLGSTGHRDLPSSSLVGSSLGMLDSNAPAPSLSGSSIWGAAPATSLPNIPNSSGLGMFSFNFVNDNVDSNTGDDDNNKGNPSNLWGAGGVSSINGGGSIW